MNHSEHTTWGPAENGVLTCSRFLEWYRQNIVEWYRQSIVKILLSGIGKILLSGIGKISISVSEDYQPEPYNPEVPLIRGSNGGGGHFPPQDRPSGPGGFQGNPPPFFNQQGPPRGALVSVPVEENTHEMKCRYSSHIASLRLAEQGAK